MHLEFSRRQCIEVFEVRGDVMLFLDGNLQFSSSDERSYHAALVSPVVAAKAARVLVVGGGDGLAVRDLLPHASAIVLVEIDIAMTQLFSAEPTLRRLNRGALSNPKVRIVNEDIREYLSVDASCFGAIVVDLPDPSSPGMSEVYNTALFRQLKARLEPGGVMSIQAVTPHSAAHEALRDMVTEAGLRATSFSAPVSSFGDHAAFLRALSDG